MLILCVDSNGDVHPVLGDTLGRIQAILGDSLPAGTNLIGKVNVVNGANILAVDTAGKLSILDISNALPAGTNLLGKVNVVNGANSLAIDASGRVSILGITNALPAGSNSIGIVDTELPAAAALTDSTGNPTTPTVGAAMLAYDGTAVNFERLRTPTTFKTLALANAVGNTAAWTPAAGKKFRLMRFQIMLSDNATQAVAGVILVTFQDGTNPMPFTFPFFVPAIALNNSPFVSTPWIDLGNGFLSGTINNVLNINLTAALTAGRFVLNMCGSEE